jgi:hypothetical protein
MCFRKKPVEVEAFRFDWEGEILFTELPEWAVEAFNKRKLSLVGSNTLAVMTLEGTMYATRGDWIIRGVEGELYPCKDSIFKKTYEKVD